MIVPQRFQIQTNIRVCNMMDFRHCLSKGDDRHWQKKLLWFLCCAGNSKLMT